MTALPKANTAHCFPWLFLAHLGLGAVALGAAVPGPVSLGCCATHPSSLAWVLLEGQRGADAGAGGRAASPPGLPNNGREGSGVLGSTGRGTHRAWQAASLPTGLPCWPLRAIPILSRPLPHGPCPLRFWKPRGPWPLSSEAAARPFPLNAFVSLL